ncbi:MAG: FtsX-like permease family protein [Bacteroidota bacterium]
MYLKLAWRNIWRSRRRTLITISSIVFAVLFSALLYSTKKGMLVRMEQNSVSFYTGYAQVHKKGYWDEKTIDNSFDQSDSLLENIKAINNVLGVYPRLESFSLAASESKTRGTLVVGIDPDGENEVTRLRDKINQGNYLDPSDRAVIITEGLANYLKLAVGDTLVLLGQGYHGTSATAKYPVKGLLKFGNPDLNNGLVYLPMKEAQWLFSAENKLTSLVLQLEENSKVNRVSDKVQASIGPDYESMSWKTMLPELDQIIKGENTETAVVLSVLYLLISFGLFGTILMMTLERSYEFGVLIAIGMKKAYIYTVVIIENFLLSLLGVLAGSILSFPVLYYFHKSPIRMGDELAEAYEKYGLEPVFYFSIAPDVFYTQALAVLIISLVISAYPLFKIARLEPVEAMRS